MQKEKRRKEIDEQESKGFIDIDKIFQADNSDASSCSEIGEDDNSKRKKSRRTIESPPLLDRSDEDEEMFLRRRNLIEEDEYVSKKIIEGLPEYNEFKIGSEKEEGAAIS